MLARTLTDQARKIVLNRFRLVRIEAGQIERVFLAGGLATRFV